MAHIFLVPILREKRTHLPKDLTTQKKGKYIMHWTSEQMFQKKYLLNRKINKKKHIFCSENILVSNVHGILCIKQKAKWYLIENRIHWSEQ